MGVELAAKKIFENLSQEKMNMPFYNDSERSVGTELSEMDGSQGLNEIERAFYPDSDRVLSEGPQWDENNLVLPESPGANKESMLEKSVKELTDDEKQGLREKLGWSDEKIKKCTIDEEGVIHFKTDMCNLEGKTSENGVPYERSTIEINNVKIEGVFPKFESAFDTELAPDNLKTRLYAKDCNSNLKEAIENNLELKSKFTPDQLRDIEDGKTPTEYVWHHNEEPGKMQLVKRVDHDRTIGGAAHTGGNSLWGAESVDNSKKGERF